MSEPETPVTTEKKPRHNDKKNKDTRSGKEIGGRKGPEPTRYGDWENNGIASDF